MEAAAFDYHLPVGAIAQAPTAVRSHARMLVDGGVDREPVHRRVDDLPTLLGPGDLLVVNDSRVLPARLDLRRERGGAVEVLLVQPLDDRRWTALVRPGRKVRPGSVLHTPLGATDLQVVVGGDAGPDGLREVELVAGDVEAALARHGAMPFPPYITEPQADPDRYQTVYANRPGSVAAPTAGLHLTTEVLDACRATGAEVAAVELHVGLGTFRPLSDGPLAQHVMHAERYVVPPTTREALARAQRVVAVGTTVVRTLESAAATGADEGSTTLFVTPGFDFQAVDVLLTNFHQPRSTLLVLLEAFMGPRWRSLYAVALADGYRFLSLGDCMVVARATG